MKLAVLSDTLSVSEVECRNGRPPQEPANHGMPKLMEKSHEGPHHESGERYGIDHDSESQTDTEDPQLHGSDATITHDFVVVECSMRLARLQPRLHSALR